MRLAGALVLLIACGDSSDAPADMGAAADEAVDEGVDAASDGTSATHDAFEVRNPDGTVVLRVAANSLPEGVDPASIAVLDGVEGTLESDDGLELFRGVTLEPSGLVFRQPAELEVRATAPGLLGGILVSDGILEPVSLRVSDDGEGLIMEIPHFTDAVIVLQPERVGGVDIVRDLSPTNVRANTEALLAPAVEAVILEAVYVTDASVRPFRFQVRGDGLQSGRLRVADLENVTLLSTGDREGLFFRSPFVWEPKFECTEAGTMAANATATLLVLSQFDGAEDPTGMSVVSPPTRISAECEAFEEDPSDDCVDSLGPETECSFFDTFIDIAGAVTRRELINSAGVLGLFGNTAYPCNLVDDGVRTVCAAEPAEFPSGAMWVVRTELSAPVPDANPTHSLVYALVLESDLDPENDWVPRDPFIWDYFQGADRWYQLEWNHLTREWSVTATQVDASQNTAPIPTAARVVISSSVISWYIPTSEVDRPTPDYRLTAFAHDGRFSERDRGGDVLGADPTEPLRPASP
ncbi:MAG: hypothetical protein AAF938_10555 [Myxococcota bacterium]